MNSALDSPLEALAFNYLSYGFLTAVNNIWAWLAFVTAAVSFWRIRVLSSTTATESIDDDGAAAPVVAEIAPPARPSCALLERQGSTKLKFSLYYKEETAEDLRGDDDGGEGEDCGGGAVATNLGFDAWSGDWEGAIALRMGDNMGWYRWQNRTVIDGNVVRLWEGRRRKHAAAAW